MCCNISEQFFKHAHDGNICYCIEMYDNVFKGFCNRDIGEGCKVRSIKNQLMCLNGCLGCCLSKTYRDKITDLNPMYNYVARIEECKCIDELYAIGEVLLHRYQQEMENLNDEHIQNKIIREAISYIHDNFRNKITLDEVASHIHISTTYLSTLFCRYTGHSFPNYVNKVRVEKSKQLLKNHDFSILDIAIECGFNSQSYFCSVFKDIVGMTPREYRKNSCT